MGGLARLNRRQRPMNYFERTIPMAEILKAKALPMKPKATAVWLVDNTALTFEQIGDFTGLHAIEVQALADEEVGRGIIGENPVKNSELSADNIADAEKDPNKRLKLLRSDLPEVKVRAKGPRYTPVSRRNDKPDAIAYVLKFHPEVSEAQICKLVGTTKPTIHAIRDRTHPNAVNLRPRHPAELGLCTYQELDKASRKGLKAQGKDPDVEAARKIAELNQAAENEMPQKSDNNSGFDFSNFLSRTSS
jgi:uncharacterized protein